MENASKALLIAGSILIVILLIAMGMRVFNSTTGTTDAVEGVMSATEIAMFNNKFNQYVGKRQSIKTVKALANTIIAHNGAAKSDAEKIVLMMYHADSFKDNHKGYCNSYRPNDILYAINTTPTDILYDIQIFKLEGGLIKEISAYPSP